MSDIIADIISRLSSAIDLEQNRSKITQIEQRVRGDWSGRWVYVAARPRQPARTAQVASALRQGHDLAKVARTFGITVRHVRRLKAMLR